MRKVSLGPLLHQLVPLGDCQLCARSLAVTEYGLCAACQSALPRPQTACKVCLIPLHANEEHKLAAITSLICGQCQRHPPAFDCCRIATLYRPPVSSLVSRYKYSASFHSGRLLAKLIADELITRPPDFLPECIIPVPLHWTRVVSRGFNQSTLLAIQVRDHLVRHFALSRGAMPVVTRLVYRRKRAHSQVTHSAQERAVNVRGAFALSPKPEIPDSAALIDDVLTTGATANEIATLLKRAGVARVEVWAAARTP